VTARAVRRMRRTFGSSGGRSSIAHEPTSARSSP
jgi:hypothetical protein